MTVTFANSCQAEKTIEIVDRIDDLYFTSSNNCSDNESLGVILFFPATGYSFQWNNSDIPTENSYSHFFYSVQNLSNGDYCVTITDENNCIKEECFTIETEQNSLQFTNIEIVDACPKGVLGSISFDIVDGTGHSNLPDDADVGYPSVAWADSPEDKDKEFRVDLSPNTYRATITNTCASENYDFEVNWDCSCAKFTEVEAHIGYDCPGSSGDGVIAIISHNEVIESGPFNFQRYEFEWAGDHLVNTISNGATAVDLNVGNYQVTITDRISQCQVTETFEVLVEEQIRITSSTISTSCPNQATGAIEFEFSGGSKAGSGINLVFWSDLPVNRTKRTGLAPGEYCASINTKCYGQPTFCFEVPSHTIDVVADKSVSSIECDNNSVQLSASGSNPPFNFEWSTGDIGPIVDGLKYDTYSVTITDNEGCSIEEEIDLQPIEIIELIEPCPGFQDGKITFSIPNPLNRPMDVYTELESQVADGSSRWLLASGVVDDPVVVVHDFLQGNTSYTLEVIQWDPFCKFFFDYHIGEQDVEREFSSFRPLLINGVEQEHVFECHYDYICNGARVEEGLFASSSKVVNEECEQDINGWETLGASFGFNTLDCGSIDIMCDDHLIETIQEPSIKGRGGEHEAFINRRYNGANYASFGWPQNTCGNVHYCPQDPLCFVNGWSGNVFQGTFSGYEHENGCIKVKCKLALLFDRDYEICGSDFLPTHWQIDDDSSVSININFNSDDIIDDEDIDSPCVPKDVSLHFLLRQGNSLQSLDNFSGSELDIYLNSPEVLSLNDEVPRCARVRFCLPLFDVVSKPDLDNIDCEELDAPIPIHANNQSNLLVYNCEYFEGVYEGQQGIWVACNGSPVFVPDEYDLGGFKDCEVPNESQLLTTKGESTEFVSFAPTKDRFQRNYFNANYIGTETSESYFHYFVEVDYNYSSDWNTLFSFNDPDNAYSIFLVKDSLINNAIQILSGNPVIFNDNILEASEDISVLNFEEKGDLYVVKGDFLGTLKYSGQTIASSSTEANQYRIEIDKDGTLVNSSIYKSDNFLSSPSKYGQSMYYKSNSTVQNISVSGMNYSGFQNGTIVEINSGASGLFQISSDFRTTGSFELVTTEFAKDSLMRYFVFKGSGKIFHKNRRKVLENSESIYVLKIDSGNNFRGAKKIPVENFYDVVPNMEVDKNDNMYLAINTRENEDSVPNLPFSIDINNISVVKLNTSLSVIQETRSSTISNVVVKDIRYSSGILFLGGNISPKEFTTKIGDMTFYDFSSNETLGYVSYIDVREDANDLSEDCSQDCSDYVQFVPNTCGASILFSGPNVDTYFLEISNETGYWDNPGFLTNGINEYVLDEIGLYTFKLISSVYNCEDLYYTVNVTDCNALTDICQSINTSASGSGNWSESFVSDGDGTLTILFDSRTVPDQLIITKNGIVVENSGFYSTNKTQQEINSLYPNCNAIGGSGQSFIVHVSVSEDDQIDLEVIADNCGVNFTIWDLVAECDQVSSLSSMLVNTRSQKKDDYIYSSVVKLYPNPVDRVLSIEYDKFNNTSYSITDVRGNVVDQGMLSAKVSTLDTKSYLPGVYFVNVFNDLDSQVTSFVKL